MGSTKSITYNIIKGNEFTHGAACHYQTVESACKRSRDREKEGVRTKVKRKNVNKNNEQLTSKSGRSHSILSYHVTYHITPYRIPSYHISFYHVLFHYILSYSIPSHPIHFLSILSYVPRTSLSTESLTIMPRVVNALVASTR
jgi:hypothetical protein